MSTRPFNADQEFQSVSDATLKMWGTMSAFRRKARIATQTIQHEAEIQQAIIDDLHATIDEYYHQIQNLCRAFTDITDAARWEATEFYNARVAPLVSTLDPRPDWWLEQEYCPRDN